MPGRFLLRKDRMQPSRALKVLLVGHPCSPGLGSEPGNTWNWAWELAAQHQVWVLAHPQYRGAAERFLQERPRPNLHFIWLTLPSWWDPWDPRRGERGIRLHYLLWQRSAFREAVRQHRTHSFDLVHHVSWNTLSAPPLMWRLPIPFVWGPVGGGQTAPMAFRTYFGSGWRREARRNLRMRFMPFVPALRQAVRRCALLLATNRETVRLLERAGAHEVRLFLDTGLAPDYLPASPPQRCPTSQLTLLWAGRLEARKALPLALAALAQMADVPARLLVAGDGPLRADWEAKARQFGLHERVRFLGKIPWESMIDLFRRADIFLFTSLQDSSGAAVFEAMAHGLPIVTLDHQGVGAFVPPEAGIMVPVTTPADTIAALAAGLRRLGRSWAVRVEMGDAAWTYARSQTWDRRAAQMSHWYGECLRRAPPGRSSALRHA
jgi:glycosyltransferase involved in cell wall biosynthesis